MSRLTFDKIMVCIAMFGLVFLALNLLWSIADKLRYDNAISLLIISGLALLITIPIILIITKQEK